MIFSVLIFCVAQKVDTKKYRSIYMRYAYMIRSKKLILIFCDLYIFFSVIYYVSVHVIVVTLLKSNGSCPYIYYDTYRLLSFTYVYIYFNIILWFFLRVTGCVTLYMYLIPYIETRPRIVVIKKKKN